MAKLIIHSGTPHAREFELKAGANRVGRGEANDFQISDASVSTHHAQIIVDGTSVLIKDLNSTNGTFINHQPVSEGALLSGQPLRLGGVELLFQPDAPVAVPKVIRIDIAPPPTPVPASTAAPVTPPPPKSGGLRLSGSQPAAAAPPPPPSAMTSAPDSTSVAAHPHAEEFFQPPPGKVACKFHPKIGGQWWCPKCSELFCPVCVSTKTSSEGTLHSCRKCGSDCQPVKARAVASKEKAAVVYSDKMLLVRSLGFGLVAALVGALIWTGLSKLFGFDVPFLFAPMVGALCGYAVKLGCQDTPGPVFSAIAVVCCLIGSVLGKVGMIAATHLTINTNTTLFTTGLGVVIAIYAAWKVGGDS